MNGNYWICNVGPAPLGRCPSRDGLPLPSSTISTIGIKRLGGDHDAEVAQEYDRPRHLGSGEEAVVCALWEHVQSCLDRGIVTEHASMSFES